MYTLGELQTRRAQLVTEWLELAEEQEAIKNNILLLDQAILGQAILGLKNHTIP